MQARSLRCVRKMAVLEPGATVRRVLRVSLMRGFFLGGRFVTAGSCARQVPEGRRVLLGRFAVGDGGGRDGGWAVLSGSLVIVGSGCAKGRRFPLTWFLLSSASGTGTVADTPVREMLGSVAVLKVWYGEIAGPKWIDGAIAGMEMLLLLDMTVLAACEL